MKTKKLNLNKQVVSNLNTINGGYAPTHDCGEGTDPILPIESLVCFPVLTIKCITKLDSVCQCW